MKVQFKLLIIVTIIIILIICYFDICKASWAKVRFDDLIYMADYIIIGSVIECKLIDERFLSVINIKIKKVIFNTNEQWRKIKNVYIFRDVLLSNDANFDVNTNRSYIWFLVNDPIDAELAKKYDLSKDDFFDVYGGRQSKISTNSSYLEAVKELCPLKEIKDDKKYKEKLHQLSKHKNPIIKKAAEQLLANLKSVPISHYRKIIKARKRLYKENLEKRKKGSLNKRK